MLQYIKTLSLFVIPVFSIRHSGAGRNPGKTHIQQEAHVYKAPYSV